MGGAVLFPHLKEVKKANKGRFADKFLHVPEEEPGCDARIQQLRAFLGERNEVESLLSAVAAAEKSLGCFVIPRRT